MKKGLACEIRDRANRLENVQDAVADGGTTIEDIVNRASSLGRGLAHNPMVLHRYTGETNHFYADL